jgi:hypothetical protein
MRRSQGVSGHIESSRLGGKRRRTFFRTRRARGNVITFVTSAILASLVLAAPSLASAAERPDVVVSDVIVAPAAPPADAGVRDWILSGFYSKHFSNDRQLNDANTGAFFEHDFARNWGLLAGIYKNSGYVESKFVAATWQPLHAGPVSLGVLFGGITGYVQLGHGRLSPGALPLLSAGNEIVKANAYCVPPVIKTAAALCALQVGVSFGRF